MGDARVLIAQRGKTLVNTLGFQLTFRKVSKLEDGPDYSKLCAKEKKKKEKKQNRAPETRGTVVYNNTYITGDKIHI